MKKNYFVSLIIYSCLLLSCSNGIDEDSYSNKISKIRDLVQMCGAPDTILSTRYYRNETARDTIFPAVMMPENILDDKEQGYYYETTIHYLCKGNENSANFVPIETSSEIYPGNLLQGAPLVTGVVSPIPLSNKRIGGRVYLNEVSGEFDENGNTKSYYRDVSQFTGSEVTQAMNDIIAKKTGGYPANTVYSHEEVCSEEEMAYKAGMTLAHFQKLTGNAFSNVSWNDKKTRQMVFLRQTFFTMAYDFMGIDSLFNSSISVSDLEPYMSASNPPCYISSVQYGRLFVLLYETDNVSPATFDNAIENILDANAIITNENKQIYTTSNVKMIQIGGDAEAGLNAALNSKNADALRKFIVEGANLDSNNKNNVAAPISYTVNYLYNSTNVLHNRSINKNVTSHVYLPKQRTNTVKLEIKKIYSNKVDRANYERWKNGIRGGDSYFELSNITIKVGSSNRFVLNPILSPNNSIDKRNRVYKLNETSFLKGYYSNNSYIINNMGIDTDVPIYIQGTVKYHIERSNDHDGERTFDFTTRFDFNKVTRKWTVDTTDKEFVSADFNCITVATPQKWLGVTITPDDMFVNGCIVKFQLYFELTCDGIKY